MHQSDDINIFDKNLLIFLIFLRQNGKNFGKIYLLSYLAVYQLKSILNKH